MLYIYAKRHFEFKAANLLYSYILATLLFSQEKNRR